MLQIFVSNIFNRVEGLGVNSQIFKGFNSFTTNNNLISIKLEKRGEELGEGQSKGRELREERWFSGKGKEK